MVVWWGGGGIRGPQAEGPVTGGTPSEGLGISPTSPPPTHTHTLGRLGKEQQELKSFTQNILFSIMTYDLVFPEAQVPEGPELAGAEEQRDQRSGERAVGA